LYDDECLCMIYEYRCSNINGVNLIGGIDMSVSVSIRCKKWSIIINK
jgi:hypothetical protein